MRGFDPEFTDLVHYIHLITARIWEGRQIGLIRRHYAADCVVHTPMGPVRGVERVVGGTLETLHAFPDRRLLAEDVIWSGNDRDGFLSSHRIISTQHHRGEGTFGPPTGRRLHVRTVADCQVRANVIDEEWLVRDQAAIVRQLDGDPRDVGARLAATDAEAGITPWHLGDAAAAAASGPRPTDQGEHPLAADLVGTLHRVWNEGDVAAIRALYAESATLHGPGNASHVGHDEIDRFLIGYLAAFPGAVLAVDHAAVLEEPARPLRVALRWRLSGRHDGRGGFGAPTGAPVLVLGITHLELWGQRVVRDFTLIDELALWKMIASKAG
jgi:predicted ester cyclase